MEQILFHGRSPSLDEFDAERQLEEKLDHVNDDCNFVQPVKLGLNDMSHDGFASCLGDPKYHLLK